MRSLHTNTGRTTGTQSEGQTEKSSTKEEKKKVKPDKSATINGFVGAVSPTARLPACPPILSNTIQCYVKISNI